MNQFNSLRGMALFLFLIASHFIWAQNIEQKLKEDKTVGDYTMNATLKTPASITFKQDALLPAAHAISVIQKLFGLNADSELRSVGITEAKGGITVEKFRQYFKGIKVEHSAYVVVSKNGQIAYITSESYPLENSFSINPQLSVDAAKGKALDFVRAEKYAWDAIEEDKRLFPNNPQIQMQLEQLKQTYLPKGELVIAKDVYGTRQARLAYRFDVFAVEPLGRYIIYVDAANGKILLRDAVIKHADKIRKRKPAELKYIPNYQYYGLGYVNHNKQSAPFRTSASVLGSGKTRYSGVRQIYTTRITVPVTGMQDPNNPAVALTYSGVDPRVPVVGQTVYILKDDTKGGGIETYDCNNVGGVPLNLPQIQAQATAFVDKDNNWKDEADNGAVTQEDLMRGATANGTVGADEARNDDIAIDAHWGASVVYDYWKNIHNRLSYDNKNSAIKSYVHYGPAYDNAFWNGSSMTYGDGSGTSANGFRPLVSLDVCGHEIGHGVCTFTSDLVYESESGAMNEGLSDIWAAAVERYAKINVDPSLTYQYFQIGEQISADNIGLRRMDNPKAKTDPDTYGGRYWQNPDCVPTLANDQCGVHTNSGVLNKWFYLMVQGPKTTTGSPAYTDDGIADKPRTTPAGTDWVENAGNNYGALTNFIGIGFDKAEQITYLMELALTPNAKFAEARAASINAARVLYGPCSQEEITVTNAWYAVNVGAAWSTCTAPTLSVNLQAVTLKEGSGDCGSYTEYTIGVSLSAAQTSATTIHFSVPSGTAEPHDYQLTATSVTYNAGEMGNRTISLRVFNDDMVEGDETINLSATSTLGAFNFNQALTIVDDDVMPRLGNTFTIFSENFETTPNDVLPAGWDTVNRTSPPGALWNVRSAQTSTLQWTTKRAYIYNPNLPIVDPKSQPLYDPNVGTQVILHTPLIDARGLDSIRLRFIWSAGGEGACSPACDYGEVVYSLDGVNFNRFDTDTTGTSASEPLYMSQTDSTYDRILPKVVSNRQFYLGFRWVHDDLATISPNSITIDNIVVTGQGKKIETDSASGVTTPVRVEPGNPVFFYSEDDKKLMSSIINASADLGCVKDTLVQTGNGVVPYPGGTRTRKVFEITPSQNSNATYTLTLYFTTQEVAGFAAAPSQLRILKSNAADIDQSNASNSIIVTPEFIDSSAQGFYGYRYTFTGFSKFALVEASSSPLPVNCLDFRAVKAANAVNLNWRVSDERNNSHFEVERSTDGVNFTKVGEVRAAATNNGQYSYGDHAVGGLRSAYYRLKQVDVTGEFKYLCTILYVSLDGRNAFTVGNIYPNPGSNNAIVNITTSEKRRIRVEYVNMAGQTLNWHSEQLQAGTTRVALKVNALAAGSYLVQFKDEENRILNTQQYIKQ